MMVTAARIEPLFGCSLTGILEASVGVRGVVPIVHGPMGCAAGHRVIPLLADLEPLVATTSLKEMDVVMGTEDRLREAIQKAHRVYDPKLIVVILTCATSLTGEISQQMLDVLSQQLNTPIFLLDGSGQVGDSLFGYASFYRHFSELTADWGCGEIKNHIELVGLSATDFASRQDLIVIKSLLLQGLGLDVVRTLFARLELEPQSWAKARPLLVGRMWKSHGTPIPAPYGANGTRAFLKAVGAYTDTSCAIDCLDRVFELERDIDLFLSRQEGRRLRIGIEGASWWGMGLASFLADELNCKIFLSSDSDSLVIADRIDEFHLDTGSTELVDSLRSFNPDIVFGSSFVRTGEWAWVPFWQPVWHVIKTQESLMGVNGARSILNMLTHYQERKYK